MTSPLPSANHGVKYLLKVAHYEQVPFVREKSAASVRNRLRQDARLLDGNDVALAMPDINEAAIRCRK